MDASEVLSILGECPALAAVRRATGAGAVSDLDVPGEGEGLVHRVALPARRAELVPIPKDLPPVLAKRLARAGVTELYAHQAEALARVRDGEHIVVATGTASGKSLCYLLPVIEALMGDDRQSALYLAPTKALAHDQLRAVRELTIPQVRAAALDGDTPFPERDAIRRTANWILTNPDLLHHSLLPDHKYWGDLLHRLRFVVIDEAHVARGVFGAHVGLVLRRLRRLCERYGAEPQFLLASATIGNPAEHAQALTGVEVTAIERDGSPRGALHLGLWEPPLVDAEAGTRRSLLREAGDLLASFVVAHVQTLVFAKSRKAAEVISLTARERLVEIPADAEEPTVPLADRVRSYRAGYLPEERRELEEALRSGDLLGMAATSALELGIDVAGLDAVVLAGFPGTIASFWQRLGRAGRTGEEATGVLVAADDPLDQYLVTHPDHLLTRPPEDAIVDATNPYILGPHLRCAAQEAPITNEEATRWFGDTAPALLADDVEASLLRVRAGRHHWVSRRKAAAEVNVRGGIGRTIRIVDTSTGALLGDVDEARAHRQVHTGAIHLHQGEPYRIDELNLDTAIAAATPLHRTSTTTRARADTDIEVLDVLAAEAWGEASVGLSRVQVTNLVTGYDVVRIGSGEVIERVDLDLPPQVLVTQAVWWTMPERLLTEEAGIDVRDLPGSLHAAEHAAIGMLPLLALCDRWDIGGLSTALHPDTGQPTVFIYDGYAGGAGLAERSHRRLGEHLEMTRDAVASCRCASGCPSCVQSPTCGNGNEPL
ncbi:MAG: DEAD/DEAH box helicase, partial [Nitriliruptorales bacterium]|nr:DEAD/DEAH box helicase [Nitriliruptorales bacterium]